MRRMCSSARLMSSQRCIPMLSWTRAIPMLFWRESSLDRTLFWHKYMADFCWLHESGLNEPVAALLGVADPRSGRMLAVKGAMLSAAWEYDLRSLRRKAQPRIGEAPASISVAEVWATPEDIRWSHRRSGSWDRNSWETAPPHLQGRDVGGVGVRPVELVEGRAVVEFSGAPWG